MRLRPLHVFLAQLQEPLMRQANRLQDMIDLVAPHFQQRRGLLVTLVHLPCHRFAFLIGGRSAVVLFERVVPLLDGLLVRPFVVVCLLDGDVSVLDALDECGELLLGADFLHVHEKELVPLLTMVLWVLWALWVLWVLWVLWGRWAAMCPLCGVGSGRR